MGNLIFRIRRRMEMTVKSFRRDCKFSMYYALLRVAAELGGRLGFRKLARRAGERKNRWIQDHLRELLADVLEQFRENENPGTFTENAPIWVCWWTGEETAPPLVKRCIRSIRENAGKHPVHLITKDNYGQYLEIPGFLLEKVDKKTMDLAHLADYIRVKLLAQNGGLWLDATIFSSETVPESCFSGPFFTCKGPVRPSGYVSDYRWVTFCLGGWEGNVFFRFLTAAFERYWQQCECAIDYLFFDHIILLAYENIPKIRQLIDAVPDNNIRRDDLQAAMNAALNAEKWDEIVTPDTAFYKLSWRETYSRITPVGQESVYAYFLREEK